MKAKYYTIYNSKTDDIIAFGSSNECAKKMKISQRAFRIVVCRAKKRIIKKYEVYEEDL